MMAEGKAIHAILGAFLLLTIGLGAVGQTGAQTGTQTGAQTPSKEAAEFVLALSSEAMLLQSAARSKPPEQRAAVFQGLVRRGFNLKLISQFVLGKFWSRATAEQQAEFQELFAEYLTNIYARHIGTYQAETINIVTSHPVGSQDVLVETSFEGSARAANPIWRIRAKDGEYKIIDVSISGVSLALTHRREFAAVINSKGLDRMLDMLRKKLAVQAKVARADAPPGDLMISLFSGILASPNANKINLLQALR